MIDVFFKRSVLARLFVGAVTAAVLCGGCSAPGNTRTNANSCVAGSAKGQSEAGLEQIELCITASGKTRAFIVEVARSSQQQAKGMMFRTALADNRGMLFPFTEAKVASFWMRNTVIPLDIIFIRANGSIESIAEDTIPYSTDPVEAGEPITAVLELRGGLAAELGIAAGDKVVWQSN